MAPDSNPVVLVVEDEQELADFYANLLADRYEVRTAYGGQEAIDQFDESVDVALLDRRMPDRSGDDVLEHIRETTTDCRVAMVTAISPELDILEMEFDDYLVKPVSKQELLDTVEGLLALTTYDERVREYYALSAKHTALLASKSEGELADSEEYLALEQRLADIQNEFENLREELDFDQLKNAFKIIDFEATSAGPAPLDEG